jgi:hypothetical protein
MSAVSCWGLGQVGVLKLAPQRAEPAKEDLVPAKGFLLFYQGMVRVGVSFFVESGIGKTVSEAVNKNIHQVGVGWTIVTSFPNFRYQCQLPFDAIRMRAEQKMGVVFTVLLT